MESTCASKGFSEFFFVELLLVLQEKRVAVTNTIVAVFKLNSLFKVFPKKLTGG